MTAAPPTRPRILHAARNIANQPADVVRALRRLGYEAEVWEYGDNPFGYEVDRTIPLDTEARDPTDLLADLPGGDRALRRPPLPLRADVLPQ